MLDLAIRHGTVVTATDTFAADVGVEAGTIVELGQVGPAREEIDASGLLVLPGGVDVHTHLSTTPMRGGEGSPDDFLSGSIAAACGGVTTIVDYARQYPGVSLADTVADWEGRARNRAVIDYSFHLIVTDASPSTLGDIPRMVEAGFPSFKIFMMRHADGAILQIMRAAGTGGGLSMVHCESAAIDEDAYRRLLAQGSASARFWTTARPVAGEAEAAARAVDYAEYLAAPIYIVHVSSARVVDRIRQGKARYSQLWAETRPCYLLLSSERYAEPDPDYLKYTGYPPLREPSDVEAVWGGLRDGVLDTVGSDHAAWSVEQKQRASHDLNELPVGLPGIEVQTRAIFSEGVSKGRISAQRFVQVMSTEPARLLGLAPRKGTIAPGSDADMVLFDPQRQATVRFAEMHSQCGYEPCEGLECTGWPVLTIARGEVIARDGQPLPAARPGRGQLLRRSRFVQEATR
jgi:dihydropyrimidinase